MWPTLLALTALLQAAGVTPGRSCEPGSRNEPTTAYPRAADVAVVVARGLIGDVVPRLEPAADSAPTPVPG